MRYALILVIALVYATPAGAFDPFGSGGWNDGHRASKRHYVRQHRHKATKVMAYQKRGFDRDRDRDRAWCKNTLSVVGNQHVTMDGARDAADKSWIQSVRFYHGEVFMDLDHAKDVRYACSRSSVGEVMGGTFNRCEIAARPCKAAKLEMDR